MNSITVRRTDGTEMIYACNSEHEGVFHRRPEEGAYHQDIGLMQTPLFRTWRQFRRFLGPVGRVVDHTFFDDLENRS